MTPATLLVGSRLTLADLVSVARTARPVALAADAWTRIALSRRVVAELVERKVKVYGLTTGFASLRHRVLAKKDFNALSLALLRSHAVGAGPPFAEDAVRAAMLLRLRSFARGCSGVHPELARLLVASLNAGLLPYVPQQGSLGASGDLAPLSHLFLAVIGDPSGRVHRGSLHARAPERLGGIARHMDRRRSDAPCVAEPRADDFVAIAECRREWAARVLAHLPPYDAAAVGFSCVAEGTVASLPPIEERLHAAVEGTLPAGEPVYMPRPKEGLAANNGATFSAAVLALAAADARSLLRTAELACALSCEALQAVPDCLDEGLVDLRDHPGHRAVAASLRAALAGSDLVPADRTRGVNAAHLNATVMALGQLAARHPSDAAALSEVRDRFAERIGEGMWTQLGARYESALAALDAAGPGCNPLGLPAERHHPQHDYGRALEVDCAREHFRPAIEAARRAAGLTAEPPTLSPETRGAVAHVLHTHADRIACASGSPEIQDNYCFRAAATVLGIVHEAVEGAGAVVETEINAVTDNPILLLDRIAADMDAHGAAAPRDDARLAQWFVRRWHVAADAVKSGANFHGEPVGAAAERLSVAAAELASIAERRVACLTDVHHSKGLPAYVCWNPGLDSAFMMPQYTAASLVSENKGLAWPQTVDSLTSGENTEDHVSMSMVATRRCAQIVANAEHVVAIELATAYQGVQFRKPARLGAGTSRAERRIAAELAPVLAELYGVPDLAGHTRRWLAERVHLAPAAAEAVGPCVLDDVALHRVIDAVAWLVRRGEIASLRSGT